MYFVANKELAFPTDNNTISDIYVHLYSPKHKTDYTFQKGFARLFSAFFLFVNPFVPSNRHRKS